MPDRAIHKVERSLAWLFLPVTIACGVAVLAAALIIANRLAAQIEQARSTGREAQAAVAALHQNALDSCRSGNAARAESNQHLRDPLRGIGAKIAGVLDQAAAAGKPKDAAATRALAAAFRSYAAQVADLPPLDCAKLNGVP